MRKTFDPPVHMGIIMDGNRRWARKKDKASFLGHEAGAETLKKTIVWAKEEGIKYLTVFAFSLENWGRPIEEVSSLMGLILKIIKKEKEWFGTEGIKIKFIGERDSLSDKLKSEIIRTERSTEQNDGINLIIAFNYGGRREIAHAFNQIIKNNSEKTEISENEIEQNLWTADLPDVDLIIRTGGERRLSGFLLWQVAYAELYFLSKYWPDFNKRDLKKALRDYGRRHRKFGK